MNPDTLEQVNQIVAAIQQHPLWAHAGLITLLVAGAMLWIAGRRVLKPIFAVLGALAGGFLGSAVVPGMGIDSMFGLSGGVAGAAVGGALGALAAILIFRVAIGVLAATVVSGLAILGASIFIQTSEPSPAELDSAADSESAYIEQEGVEGEQSFVPESVREQVRENVGAVASGEKKPGQFVSDLYRGLKAELWDPLDGGDKMLLTSSGLAGLVAGLALGVFAPRKTTALVTAFAGAGMWLPALYFLSQSLDLPGKAMFERTPVEWLAIWLVLSMTGLFIQWQGLKKKDDRKSRKDDDDEDEDEEDED